MFGCAYGWERPNWFARGLGPAGNGPHDARPAFGRSESAENGPCDAPLSFGRSEPAEDGPRDAPPTFGRPAWRETVAAECRAVRDRAGLVDLSAFSKFEIAGADAPAFMERLGANRRRGRWAGSGSPTP